MGQDDEQGEPPPPWVALPDLSPDDPATQGPADAYVSLTFLPFWSGLTAPQKAAYLDRWNASEAWRAAIAFRYDHEGFDLEADAEDAAAWRAASAEERPPRWWWPFRRR